MRVIHILGLGFCTSHFPFSKKSDPNRLFCFLSYTQAKVGFPKRDDPISAVFHLSSGCISWRHEPDMRPEIPQVPCRPGRFHHRTLQVSGRHGRFAQVAQNDLSFCFWWVSYSFASFIVTVLATPTLVYKYGIQDDPCVHGCIDLEKNDECRPASADI